MMAFDKHIPSTKKEAVIGCDFDLKFLFSSILAKVCGKNRLFRLYYL